MPVFTRGAGVVNGTILFVANSVCCYVAFKAISDDTGELLRATANYSILVSAKTLYTLFIEVVSM